MERQDRTELRTGLMVNELRTKKILVTGATGHLGRALVQQLLRSDIQPYVLLHRQTMNISDYPSPHLLYGDLAYPEDLEKIKPQLQEMEIVIHCAAHVPKTAQDDDWENALPKNVFGALALVSKLSPTTKFVFVSTCEVYGISGGMAEQLPTLPISEEHPLHPQSYYGFSKQMAEQALQLYCRKNNLPLTILRLANIYGPGETIQRAIPNFIRAALAGRDLEMYGDGSELRDFIYLDDAARGLLSAAWKGKNTIYNLASGKGVTIKEVAEKIITLCSPSVSIRFQERQKRKIDYVFDIGRAHQDFDFRPSTSLEEGLRREVEWFQQQQHKEEPLT